MKSKRALWIAEGILGLIGVVAMFMHYEEIAMACVVAVAATMNQLVEKE